MMEEPERSSENSTVDAKQIGCSFAKSWTATSNDKDKSEGVTVSETFHNYSNTRTKEKESEPVELESEEVEVIAVVDQSSDLEDETSDWKNSTCTDRPQGTEPVQSSPTQGPMLLNLDSHENVTQGPFVPPHVSSGGTQPALVFFLGSPGVTATGEIPSVSTAGASSMPFANALFFTQPVTLSVVPQDSSSSSSGVIEKAMELANFQTNPAQSEYPQNSAQVVVSTGGLIPANTNSCTMPPGVSQDALPTDQSFGAPTQVSQNIVIAQSVVTGENVPIDNVSQSITVQTSQVMQNPGLTDLQSFAGELPAGMSSAEAAGTVQADSYEERPKINTTKKSVRIREVMTQTGAEPEIMILAERRLDIGEGSPEEPVNNWPQKTVKKPEAAKVRRYGCDKCNKKFFTNNDLRRHQTSHQDSRPFICQECQKGFRTAGELNIHKAIHVQVKQYKCEYCGKEFRTKGCIKSHIKYHIGDKRHKCTECDRAFVKSADLKRHMAGHKNEKNFECEDCGSAFTRRDNLKAHRLLHSRESVVTCDLCSKEFINAVYLKRHMHIHKQAKKKPYECQWCPKTYEQLEGLRRHIRQHVGDEKFICKECGKKFITNIQLKRHLWLSHDQDSPYRKSILS